jgi:hypothetical protein
MVIGAAITKMTHETAQVFRLSESANANRNQPLIGLKRHVRGS